MNIKNGSVKTLPLYLFCHTYVCLLSYNELFITETHEQGNGRQKMFPKVVISKMVIKNSYVSETSQNDNQDKVKPFETSFHFLENLQTGETIFQRKVFQSIVWVPVAASI